MHAMTEDQKKPNPEIQKYFGIGGKEKFDADMRAGRYYSQI
jgi:hypothetical protein